MLNIEYSNEVKNALVNNLPIVALESTIISFGMPYPENVKVAKECEERVRKHGSVPAIIAIINGKIKVGLNEEELEFMAKSNDIIKVSRRDLPYIVSLKLNGATTVASTMMIASMAGIKFFATGGIGGVHRGFSEAMDVSADLEELARTNVTVVSAGAKSILDLEKTLEYLETKGVLVVGYKTDELPATNKSGIEVPKRMDDALDIALMIKTKEDLGITSGLLITNPISDEYSLDKAYIDNAINEALKLAKEQDIKGKDITPFLLFKINEITKGSSLEANIHLVYSNCELASTICKAYNYLKNK